MRLALHAADAPCGYTSPGDVITNNAGFFLLSGTEVNFLSNPAKMKCLHNQAMH
jgi:hypothetical protein